MKVASIPTAVYLLLAAAAWGQEHGPDRTVGETLPSTVRNLVGLADVEVPAEILRSDQEWLIASKREGVARWVEMIIDEAFLPDRHQELKGHVEMWTHEAESRDETFDVARVKWRRNGWRIVVLQTVSTFVVVLERESGQAGSPGAQTVKQLAREFLRDHTEVAAPGDKLVLPGGTRSVLMSKSFGPSSVKQRSDGLVGVPESLDWQNPEDRRGYNQWWRQIGWWQKGNQIGFFTVKAQAGQLRMGYGVLDKGWFSPGQRSKTDTRPSLPPRDYAVSPPKDLADALRQFREERPRIAAARMIEPLLKKGMDRKEVEEMLGPPTKVVEDMWAYGLGEDELMSNYWTLFFERGKLLDVNSTLRPQPVTQPAGR